MSDIKRTIYKAILLVFISLLAIDVVYAQHVINGTSFLGGVHHGALLSSFDNQKLGVVLTILSLALLFFALLHRQFRQVLEKETQEFKISQAALIHQNQTLEAILKQRTDSVLKSEQNLRSVIDLLPIGILLVDPETRKVVQANPAANSMINGHNKDIIGQHCHNLVCNYSFGVCPVKDLKKEMVDEEITIDLNGKAMSFLKTVTPIHLDDKEFHLESLIDITDRKHDESILLEKQALIDAILNSSPDHIFAKDLDGKYLLFGKSIGVNADDVLGKTDFDMFDIEQSAKWKEEDIEVVTKGVTLSVENKGVFGGQEDAIFETTKSPIYSKDNNDIIGVIGISRNISVRKIHEAKIQQAKENVEFVLNSVPVGIAIKDWVKDRYVYVNPALRRMFELDEELCVADETLVFKDFKHLKCILLSLEKKGFYHSGNLEMVKKHTREEMWADITILRGNYLNSDSALICIYDVTDNNRLQLALRKEKKNAEEANNAKSNFLANISHEIRTPMNAIIGYSDLLSKYVGDRQLNKYASSIKSNGVNLLDLINNILDVTKIEAGELSIKKTAIDILSVIEGVENLFALKIEQKGLMFIRELNPLLPRYIIMDALRLRQILINLVGNAIKFTESGKITLGIDVYGNLKDKKDIIIKVADEGIGIASEYQQKIFEAFQQVESEDTRNFEGSGLGLSITMRLAKMLNGYVSVESEVGKGSVFTVVLPAVKVISKIQYANKTDCVVPIDDIEMESKQQSNSIVESIEIALSTKQINNLDEIVKELNQILKKEWGQVESNHSIKNVKVFVSKISDFNNMHEFEILSDFIDRFNSAIENFDISEFKILARQFPQIVGVIQKKVVHCG